MRTGRANYRSYWMTQRRTVLIVSTDQHLLPLRLGGARMAQSLSNCAHSCAQQHVAVAHTHGCCPPAGCVGTPSDMAKPGLGAGAGVPPGAPAAILTPAENIVTPLAVVSFCTSTWCCRSGPRFPTFCARQYRYVSMRLPSTSKAKTIEITCAEQRQNSVSQEPSNDA